MKLLPYIVCSSILQARIPEVVPVIYRSLPGLAAWLGSSSTPMSQLHGVHGTEYHGKMLVFPATHEVIIWQTLQPAVLLSFAVKWCNVELSLPPGRGSLSVAGFQQRHCSAMHSCCNWKEKGNEAQAAGGGYNQSTSQSYIRPGSWFSSLILFEPLSQSCMLHGGWVRVVGTSRPGHMNLVHYTRIPSFQFIYSFRDQRSNQCNQSSKAYHILSVNAEAWHYHIN